MPDAFGKKSFETEPGLERRQAIFERIKSIQRSQTNAESRKNELRNIINKVFRSEEMSDFADDYSEIGSLYPKNYTRYGQEWTPPNAYLGNGHLSYIYSHCQSKAFDQISQDDQLERNNREERQQQKSRFRHAIEKVLRNFRSQKEKRTFSERSKPIALKHFHKKFLVLAQYATLLGEDADLLPSVPVTLRVDSMDPIEEFLQENPKLKLPPLLIEVNRESSNFDLLLQRLLTLSKASSKRSIDMGSNLKGFLKGNRDVFQDLIRIPGIHALSMPACNHMTTEELETLLKHSPQLMSLVESGKDDKETEESSINKLMQLVTKGKNLKYLELNTPWSTRAEQLSELFMRKGVQSKFSYR